MSTLEPKNPWIPLPRESKKWRGAIEQWYPTYGNIQYLSPSELNKATRAKWYRNLIYAARRDPNVFIELAMDNTWSNRDLQKTMIQSWFHEELHRLLNKGMKSRNPHRIAQAHRYAAIALPRGAGKTTQVIGRVLWEFGNDPNLRIKLVAESKEVAVQRVYEIKTHIERNAYLGVVFPNLRGGDTDQWTNKKIYLNRDIVSRDPSLIAAGVFDSGTGGRADILIGDDVVSRRNAMTQSKLRKEVKGLWWSTWVPQLTKTGRIFYIFTPWHKDDLSHEIVKKQNFVTFTVPVGPNFETPWPERWTQEELIDKYELLGKTEFARAYWLEASEDSEPAVAEEWIQYTDVDPEVIKDMGVVLSVDLAVGKSSGDFFAIAVLAWDRNKQKVIALDYVNKRMPLPKQILEIRRLADVYKPDWIVVESVGMQEVLADTIRDSAHLTKYRSRIFTFTPNKSKRLRLESISPNIQSGEVLFERSLSPYTAYEHGELIEQLIEFGIAAHDDISDAFVQGVVFLKRNLNAFRSSKSEVLVF